MAKLNKSGKRLKKIRGKDGRIRAYWTGRNKKELHNDNMGERPGFLARHGGKLLAGAALVGGALMARKRLGLGQAGVWKGSVAHQNRQVKPGLAHNLMSRAKDSVMAYRQGHAGALANHLTQMAGGAALSHLGARFGQTAGTAIGSMLGPGGAAIGGFLGGHAGEFLANRHGSGHVSRLASGIAARIQGNHVPNKPAVPVSFGGPHGHMTPPPGNSHALPAPSPAVSAHAAASHAAHTHPASQPRSFTQPVIGAGPMQHTNEARAPLQGGRAERQAMANAQRQEREEHKARERAHRLMTGKRWWQR